MKTTSSLLLLLFYLHIFFIVPLYHYIGLLLFTVPKVSGKSIKKTRDPIATRDLSSCVKNGILPISTPTRFTEGSASVETIRRFREGVCDCLTKLSSSLFLLGRFLFGRFFLGRFLLGLLCGLLLYGFLGSLLRSFFLLCHANHLLPVKNVPMYKIYVKLFSKYF
jgi:hypothetical protein